MSKPILITGKNSQLAMSFYKLLNSNDNFFLSSKYKEINFKYNHKYIFSSRNELDLSNPISVEKFFQNNNFSLIINCAAYTNVDQAEKNKLLSEQINSIAVNQLAEIAKRNNIPLVHISTDYVFGGDKSEPFIESDRTSPKNIYGVTKLKGENSIIDSGCTGAIIRTSWLYSEFGNNFLKTMLNLGKKKEIIEVVNDQVGSPTYSSNLARVLLIFLNNKYIIENLNSKLDIYHYTDEGFCSWYDFAKEIFKLTNIGCKVLPVKSCEYQTLANRPLNNLLSKDKIRNLIPDFDIPHWKSSLSKCLFEIKSH